MLRDADPQPSLDRIVSIVTPDLESQEHILWYQAPIAIQRYDVGLLVVDSVAANFRAEFETPGLPGGAASMAKRQASHTRHLADI
jgi:DNA repair protein RAD57